MKKQIDTCALDGACVTKGIEERDGTPVPLTRIFITQDGDLVVTDLWDEVRELCSFES